MKNGSRIPRRHFLIGASSLGLALSRLPSASIGNQESEIKKWFDVIRANLLQLINEERAVEKCGPLTHDELASRVATEHAADMATRDFASHWGSNGLKPYMRYSFSGGHDATEENVSAADNTWSMKFADLVQDTNYLHVRLYQEEPPNDGHRRSILAPQHTHVGFGLAVDKLRLRLVEMFIAKYVQIETIRRNARPRDTLEFSGRLLNSTHLLNNVEVFYEPLPKPPELSWLRETRSYSLPNDSVVLLPRLVPPFMYADKRTGVIEVRPDGSFSFPLTLFRAEPGIYTVVCWVKRSRPEKAFPATEICVRAE